MRKFSVFWFADIVLPLIAGLAVYLILKPSAYVSKLVFDCLRLPPIHLQVPNDPFWNFVRYYLCDLLWAFSFTAAATFLLGGKRTKMILSFSVCILVGTVMELLQKYGVISGTFDVCDLIAESAGAILSLTLIFMYLRRKENEK